MTIRFFGALAAVVGLAACNSAKTPLTQEQFAEVQANCNLGGASFGAANSTETGTNPDGSTYTITTEYEGEPGLPSIALPRGMGDAEVGAAIACLSGEFDRLGAEAAVQPPAMDLGF